MSDLKKPPCLYPLPDGRRCCECDTCQGHDKFGVDTTTSLSGMGGSGRPPAAKCSRARGDLGTETTPPTREAFERRERLIREYQRRARAAVRVLTEHNLTEAYLLAYREEGERGN